MGIANSYFKVSMSIINNLLAIRVRFYGWKFAQLTKIRKSSLAIICKQSRNMVRPFSVPP